MRWALVSKLEVDIGKRRCGTRAAATLARAVDGEPHDAVKSRGTRVRRIDNEPTSAAKGARAARTPGEIRC